MDVPNLVGGGLLRIKSHAISAYSGETRSSRPSLHGFVVLGAIADRLLNAGYETSKPKRGKPDDVRIQCRFRDHYIELMLITEDEKGDVVTFSLEAWSFWSKGDPAAILQRASQEWGRISALIESVAINCFDSGSMSPLTSEQIDARYAAKQRP